MPPIGVANGPMDLKFGIHVYIAYISVSKSTPLAVTGPHGQLASFIFCQLGSASYRRLVLKEVPLPLYFLPSASVSQDCGMPTIAPVI